jgi:hypothetical protein
MKFSERIGAVRRVLQKDSMDDTLKNALWNVTYLTFWNKFDEYSRRDSSYQGRLLTALWIEYFSLPIDDLRQSSQLALQEIRERFMASGWASVYDFVEFVATCKSIEGWQSQFIGRCNAALEKHVSAYRFVGDTLAPITSEEEIAAVEQTLGLGGKFSVVAEHIQTALTRLADRDSPDYRNSIKESISAVESACKIITGDQTATLGQVLKQLGVHQALKNGFSAIYGYTNDADGIRHALLDETTVDADDAKFFLVSCSAFVNYLIAKSVDKTAV